MSYSQFFKALVACGLERVGCDLRSNFCIVRLYLASLPPYHRQPPDSTSKVEPLRKSFTALFTATSDPPIYKNPTLVRQLLATAEENPLPGEFTLLMYLLDQEVRVCEERSDDSTVRNVSEAASREGAIFAALRRFGPRAVRSYTSVRNVSAAYSSVVSCSSLHSSLLVTE